MKQIEVYKNEQFVGTLYRTPQGSRFEFSKEAMGRKITYRITAKSEALDTVGVNLPPYFAGLLPEGLRLKSMVKNLKTSEDDLFSLLIEAGQDPVGDLHFKLPEKKLMKSHFSIDDFSKFKNEILKSGESLNNPVSGVQNKISGSRLTLPLKTGIKSHSKQFIIKFDSKETPDLVENEWQSLRLAKACGLRVNDAKVIRDLKGEKALLVTRFDRLWLPLEKKLLRFHQEDACQFLDLYPADKYNLTMQDIADGFEALCESPRIEILNLLKISAFSYLIGNGDLHGKNISLIQKNTSEVSPVYDMVCTYAYGDQQMALAMDGKKDNWKRKLFVDFGERYGVPAVSMEKMLDLLVSKFAKNKDILWSTPFLAKKRSALEQLFKRRLQHLGSG